MNNVNRVIKLLVGIIFLALGTAMCRGANFGVDPFNAFAIACTQIFNVNLGPVIIVINGIMMIGILLLNKKYIAIGTIIITFMIGYIIDFFSGFFIALCSNSQTIVVPIVTFALGICSIAFGMSLYFESNLGRVPYDAVAYVCSERTGKKPFIFRVLLDGTVAVIAFLLGGPISFGTIIIAFSVGPLVDIFSRITSRFLVLDA